MSDNSNDPWNRKRPKPPELDQWVKNWTKKIDAAFGRGSKKTGAPKGGAPTSANTHFLGLIAFLLFLIWLIAGVYIVAPAEQAVVLRFGKYVRTEGPGPHWLPRFIERNITVNIQRVSTFPYSAEMLTKDENIVSVALAIQFRINNARDFLFNVVKPIESLKQATASALRQVVGETTLDEILTTGRERAREQVSDQLRLILDRYQPGLLVTDVTLQPAKPPEQVTAAFDDAIKAREDEQKFINKARAHAERVSFNAKGREARILREADAYRQQIVLKAQGDVAPYLALLPQYRLAPNLTRTRLYLDAMESVLSRSSKVLLDVKGTHPLIYVPLEQWMKQRINPHTAIQSNNSDAALPESKDTPNDVESSLQSAQNSHYPDRIGYPMNEVSNNNER